jgi:hypothetical protein
VLRAVRRHPGGSESGLGCGGPASLGRVAFSYAPRTCPTIAGCRGGRTLLLFSLLFVDLSVPSSPCNPPVLPQEFLRVFDRGKAIKAAGRRRFGHLSGSSSLVSRTRSMLRGCNPISPIHPSTWKECFRKFGGRSVACLTREGCRLARTLSIRSAMPNSTRDRPLPVLRG